MVDVALNQGAGPVSSRAIAERQEVSRGYLEQLMLQLASRGLVRPVRGRKGGFLLSRPASEITLAEVVEALEGPIGLVDCTGDSSACDRADSCVTRDVWEEISQKVDRHLSSLTLADMTERHKAKRESLAASYSI